jgi:hypothetical protein
LTASEDLIKYEFDELKRNLWAALCLEKLTSNRLLIDPEAIKSVCEYIHILRYENKFLGSSTDNFGDQFVEWNEDQKTFDSHKPHWMKIFEHSRYNGRSDKNPISYKNHASKFEELYDEPDPELPRKSPILFKPKSEKRDSTRSGNSFAYKKGAPKSIPEMIPDNSTTYRKNMTRIRTNDSPSPFSDNGRLVTLPTPGGSLDKIDFTDRIMSTDRSNLHTPIKPLDKDQLNIEYVTLQTQKKTVFNKLTKFIVNGIEKVPVDESILFLRDTAMNNTKNGEEFTHRDEFLLHDNSESV